MARAQTPRRRPREHLLATTVARARAACACAVVRRIGERLAAAMAPGKSARLAEAVGRLVYRVACLSQTAISRPPSNLDDGRGRAHGLPSSPTSTTCWCCSCYGRAAAVPSRGRTWRISLVADPAAFQRGDQPGASSVGGALRSGPGPGYHLGASPSSPGRAGDRRDGRRRPSGTTLRGRQAGSSFNGEPAVDASQPSRNGSRDQAVQWSAWKAGQGRD